MTLAQLKKQIRIDFGHDYKSIENPSWKRDGTLVLRRGFFYTNGYDSGRFAAKKLEELTAKYPEWEFVSVYDEEHWNNWPKDSWWEAAFSVRERTATETTVQG